MKSFFNRFLIYLLLTFILTFGLHAGLTSNFFKLPVANFLLFSYKFNFGITLLFTTTIIFLSRKLKHQIGFIFLSGTAIKLILFTAISNYKGFEIDRSTALDFFIPYSACLFVEIFMVSKILNKGQNH